MKSLRSLAAAALIGAMALAAPAVAAVKSFAYDVGAALSDAGKGMLQTGGFVLGLVTLGDAYTGKYPLRLQNIDSSVNEVAIPIVFPTVAPALNDILAVCKIPPNCKIVDWFLLTDALDSNGAPTLQVAVGSLNSASAPTALTTSYGTGITSVRAGGITRASTQAAYLESAAAERPVGIQFTAAAATYVPGKTGVLVLKLADL